MTDAPHPRGPELDAPQQRRELRRLRRSLDDRERVRAESAIARELSRLRFARPGRRIGAYHAVRGEASLEAFITIARRRGALLYFPRVTQRRARRMEMLPVEERHALVRGAYGIPAPGVPLNRRARALDLDLVLVPLLGFDARGHRLGMGVGFYDRWLRRRLEVRGWRRPLLVGIGFACQQLPAIAAQPWDVRMDLVVTERGVIQPPRRRATEPARRDGDLQQ